MSVLRELGRRLFNFMYGLDVAVAGLGGAPPLESISGSVGRNAEAGMPWCLYFWEPVINFLASPWQKDHCRTVGREELARRNVVVTTLVPGQLP